MKASELRVGNQLMSGIVTEITKDSFTVFDGFSNWNSKKMTEDWLDEQPIKIVEEWLVQFGFESDTFISSREFILDEIKLVNHYGDGFLFIRKGWSLGIFIKHVHQLQNLYFALTGEELIPKEL